MYSGRPAAGNEESFIQDVSDNVEKIKDIYQEEICIERLDKTFHFVNLLCTLSGVVDRSYKDVFLV